PTYLQEQPRACDLVVAQRLEHGRERGDSGATLHRVAHRLASVTCHDDAPIRRSEASRNAGVSSPRSAAVSRSASALPFGGRFAGSFANASATQRSTSSATSTSEDGRAGHLWTTA